MQTVYQCIFGAVYKDLCAVPKGFLQANVRVLEIRDFQFVLDVFNKAFVNFQMDMRTRNVEVPNTTPLNSHTLVIACFVHWFSFSTDMFTQETESVFRLRPRFSLEGKESTISTTTSKGKKANAPVLGAKPTAVTKNPCIRHLASVLGIRVLAGENPVKCKMGAHCRYSHYTLPLDRVQRKVVIDFVSSSSIGLLKLQTDRDLMLQKI